MALAIAGSTLVSPSARASATQPSPSATTVAPPLPPPKAWVLVDADTGNVVDAGNDRAPLPPASLSKVITALAARDLAPDTPIVVSDRAAAAPADKLFMKAGLTWTADQLLHTLLMSSANDAAVSLAEQVGGSLEGFRPVLARTALGLGMADQPVLVDPAGLDGPDGVDGGNFVSARDLAIAGRALLTVASLAAIVATPVYYFDGPDKVHHRLTNHNKLFLTTYPGGIGVKTGYTKRAGACLMAAARVGGRTMLAVVLSSANPTAAAKALLDKGFATPVSAESVVDQLPPVNLGANPLPPSSSATATAPLANPPAGGDVAPAATRPPAVAPRTDWLLPGGGALAILLVGLGLLAGPRRRSRRRRRRRSSSQPNLWDDRRAA